MQIQEGRGGKRQHELVQQLQGTHAESRTASQDTYRSWDNKTRKQVPEVDEE
ncbi:hypothetical protein GYH30_004180 [Glycine max]|nr:hypothetical protein GYH30_004180 [Glycine max]